MNYNRIDFLEFFDSEQIIDEEPGIFRYNVSSKEGLILSIFMIVCEGSICFKLSSKEGFDIVSFAIDDVAYIKCDKNKPGTTKFLFYKENEQLPIVTAHIKPTISLSLDIEQKGTQAN